MEGFPSYDSGTDCNIQAVLGAFLYDFDASVAGINNGLVYTVHFVAQYDCQRVFLSRELGKRNTSMGLFKGENGVPLCFQFLYHGKGVGMFRPGNRNGCSQCSLFDLPVWGRGRNTAEVEVLDQKCIRRPKN